MPAPVRPPPDEARVTPAPPVSFSAGYAWYVVGVLTLVYVFSFIDRQILTMLVRPIRRDLGISDTEMSVLMGFSFAVFYTSFGILLGRLADTRSRRSIIAAGFTVWSLFTAACGLVRSFAQMLLCRIGVGVGESALSPAAYSLITDYFPRERLATALSVYSMGIYIGSGLAYLLGGIVVGFATKQESWMLPVVGATRPWQLIFFIVGLPGVICAALLYTVREPLRRGLGAMTRVPMGQTFGYIGENWRTFLCHNVGFGLLSFTSYASGAWVPELFRRNFHWDITRTGLTYGAEVAIFGSIGIVSAGRIADWWRGKGTLEANLRVGVYIALLAVPFHLLAYLAPTGTRSALWLIPSCFLAAAPFGVSAAAIQQMMPAAMRGQASAVYLFVINIIGLGLGPTAVAATTQYLFGRDEAVNYALAIVTVGGSILSALILWAGLRPFQHSLERLKKYSES